MAAALTVLVLGCADDDSRRAETEAPGAAGSPRPVVAKECAPTGASGSPGAGCANAVATRIGPRTRSLNLVADVSSGSHTREIVTAADVRRTKMHGFDHFRVLVPLRLAMSGRATNETIEAFHQALASDLRAWLDEEIAVTLVAYPEASDMPTLIGTPAGRQAFAGFLGDLARRYAHLRADLMSFEILNEPSSVTGSVASDCAFPACLPPVWREIQAGFIQAIRTAAPAHTIIVSAADWNNYPALLRFEPYADPNLVYAIHYYPAQVFVAQSAWRTEYGLRYPACLTGNRETANAISNAYDAAEAKAYVDEGWRRERIRADLSQVADWAARKGVTVFLNEMAAYSLDLESRARWVRDVRLVAEEFGMPWSVWAVTDYYTRGWVAGDRLPVVGLLRGVRSMPWVLRDPGCAPQATARVNLSAGVRAAESELRLEVGNAGPDTAGSVELRVGVEQAVVVGATTPSGTCRISRTVVVCTLGPLSAGSRGEVLVTTSAADHRLAGVQVIVVSDDHEMDETDNFAVHALADIDGDGISDAMDDDRDGDGLPDWFEAEWGTSRSDPRDQLADPDGDGFSNLAEAQARSRALPFGSGPHQPDASPQRTPSPTLFAAASPLVRSAGDSGTWTASVSLYNAGPSPASNCSVAPRSGHPVTFLFHPIDAVGGEVDGPAFQPRTVGPGERQDFAVFISDVAPPLLRPLVLRAACQDGRATVAVIFSCRGEYAAAPRLRPDCPGCWSGFHPPALWDRCPVAPFGHN
jgi:GNAT superfamily N-acetyltransferase